MQVRGCFCAFLFLCFFFFFFFSVFSVQTAINQMTCWQHSINTCSIEGCWHLLTLSGPLLLPSHSSKLSCSQGVVAFFVSILQTLLCGLRSCYSHSSICGQAVVAMPLGDAGEGSPAALPAGAVPRQKRGWPGQSASPSRWCCSCHQLCPRGSSPRGHGNGHCCCWRFFFAAARWPQRPHEVWCLEKPSCGEASQQPLAESCWAPVSCPGVCLLSFYLTLFF